MGDRARSRRNVACALPRLLRAAPSRSDVVLSWVNHGGAAFKESHHEISHYGTDEKESQSKLTTINNQWYAQQIADGMSNRFGDTAFCKGPIRGLTV